jgi:hypothetical protein
MAVTVVTVVIVVGHCCVVRLEVIWKASLSAVGVGSDDPFLGGGGMVGIGIAEDRGFPRERICCGRMSQIILPALG